MFMSVLWGGGRLTSGRARVFSFNSSLKIFSALLLSVFLITGCGGEQSGGDQSGTGTGGNGGSGNSGNTGGSGSGTSGDNSGTGTGGNTGTGDSGTGSGTGDSGGSEPEPVSPQYTDLLAEKVMYIGGLVYAEAKDGKRYVWGNVGELAGVGNTEYITEPKEVGWIIQDKYITDTGGKSGLTYYVLTDKGIVYAWGCNEHGQVGNGTISDVPSPKIIKITERVKSIFAEWETVYAMTNTEEIYAWGDNSYGRVGDGTTFDVFAPKKIGIRGFVIDIVNTQSATYVRTDRGLYAIGVGYRSSGSPSSIGIRQVGLNGSLERIFSGVRNTYVVTSTGFYALDSDDNGKITTTKIELAGNIEKFASDYAIIDATLYRLNYYDHTPEKIELDATPIDIISQGRRYVITEAGSLYSLDHLVPVKIELDGNLQKVIPTGDESFFDVDFAITDTGLYAWQLSDYYMNSSNSFTPRKVIDGKVNTAISLWTTNENNYPASSGHTNYAATSTGLYAWGYNTYGQIGNGNTTDVDAAEPVKVLSESIRDVITEYCSIIEELPSIYAMADTGELYTWGNNSYGQVGNGTSGERVLTPYKVQVKK